MEKLKYSVIIPVYNRPDEVDELLDSLAGQGFKDFEVIVVEDGSSRPCGDVCAKYNDRLAIGYYRKENGGPGPARNYGALRAKGEWLIILDSDVVVPGGYFEAIEKELATSPADAFGGPDRAHENFTDIQKAINYSMTSFFTTGGIRGGKNRMDKFYPRSFNLGIRKSVFEALGGFSDMRYGEDIDLSIRIFKDGYRCRLFPEAWVYHKRRTSFSQFFRQVRNSGKARISLYRKYPESLKPVHVLPAIFTVVCALLVASSVFSIGNLSLPAIYALILFTHSFALQMDSSDEMTFAHAARISALSVAASFIQLIGYGSGFLHAWIEKEVLKKRLPMFLIAVLLTVSTSFAQTHRVTVSGYVTDAQTGETLIGAGILSEKEGTGAVTNNFGFYTLTMIADAPVRLQYSYLGYESVVITVPAKDTVVNMNLNPSLQISEAVIVASKEAGIKSTYLGAVEVPIKQIQATPMLFGESDVLKAVQLMPGVQGGNEGMTGLYVRGGGPDENLIMLDGVPIYNVDHMLGLFSVFQPEAVKKVTLYKGSFPARYGGRVSSILDIRTNDGNMKETKGMFSIGVVSQKFHLEGPVIKDKLSYSISARGMHTAVYAPIIKATLKDKYANYFFYDLTGKVTWRISDRDRLYFGAYKGGDIFGIKQNSEESGNMYDGSATSYSSTSRVNMGINWGNTVASVRWNHIFSNRLFANVSAATTFPFMRRTI